jgi:hypothetical protein
MRAHPVLLAVLAVIPGFLSGQQHRAALPQASAPPRESSQFDFLVGQWEVEVRPKVSSLAAWIHGAPKLLATWKAWKVLDGYAIEDELRIVDGSGNPTSLTLGVRVWSATDRRWNTTGVDALRGRVSTGTATSSAAGLELLVQGTDANGRPTLTRSRFTGVTPKSFTFTQDRSGDDGKTWETGVLVMEARRVSATAPR